MSDFLARLTARHTERLAPTIVPRALSRFESSSLPVDRDVAESTISEAAQRSARDGETAPVSPERRSASLARPIAESVVRQSKIEVAPTERAVLVQTRVEQILKHVETIVNAGPTRVEPRIERAHEQAIVATPAGPRIVPSVEPHTPAAGRSVVAQTTREQSEPTVIRVHIGRIEVRGPPQPAERPRLRAAKGSEPAKPMSLDRYLSGKERA